MAVKNTPLREVVTVVFRDGAHKIQHQVDVPREHATAENLKRLERKVKNTYGNKNEIIETKRQVI